MDHRVNLLSAIILKAPNIKQEYLELEDTVVIQKTLANLENKKPDSTKKNHTKIKAYEKKIKLLKDYLLNKPPSDTIFTQTSENSSSIIINSIGELEDIIEKNFQGQGQIPEENLIELTTPSDEGGNEGENKRKQNLNNDGNTDYNTVNNHESNISQDDFMDQDQIPEENLIELATPSDEGSNEERKKRKINLNNDSNADDNVFLKKPKKINKKPNKRKFNSLKHKEQFNERELAIKDIERTLLAKVNELEKEVEVHNENVNVFDTNKARLIKKIEKFNKDRQTLEENKKKLEKDKLKLNENMSELSLREEQLNNAKKHTEIEMENLNCSKSQHAEQIKNFEDKQNVIQSTIENIIKELDEKSKIFKADRKKLEEDRLNFQNEASIFKIKENVLSQ